MADVADAAPAVEIGPAAYARWRATTLGAVSEALEHRLILGLVGDVAGQRVLDAGCGDGVLARALATRGANVTGLDADPAMVAAARVRASRSGVRATFVEGRIDELPFPDGSFDAVVAVTVLCFVPDAAAAIRELARVLRPGGRLVIGELGRWSVWAMLRRFRDRLGPTIWRRARFRSASELSMLLRQAGISVDTVRGAVFYPPLGAVARVLAGVDLRLGRLTTLGAAFIAIRGTTP